MHHTITDQPLVPIDTPKQRLPLYKEMLRLVETQEYSGLCIGLIEQSGRPWRIYASIDRTEHTDILFPEFGKHICGYTPITKLELMEQTKWGTNKITQAWRLAVLNDCIKQCNNAILK
jgi:hypothetical protein